MRQDQLLDWLALVLLRHDDRQATFTFFIVDVKDRENVWVQKLFPDVHFCFMSQEEQLVSI